MRTSSLKNNVVEEYLESLQLLEDCTRLHHLEPTPPATNGNFDMSRVLAENKALSTVKELEELYPEELSHFLI